MAKTEKVTTDIIEKKKKYKFREVYKTKIVFLKKEGWEDATEEEKIKYGNKKYKGGPLTLMKKEVA